jgi:hypothetical protein
MFADFMASSKIVTAVIVALSITAFFWAEPWYYGLLAAIGVFIMGTIVISRPFHHRFQQCEGQMDRSNDRAPQSPWER